MRLEECSAVVTGASSGIGRATAMMLARRGCRLVLCGRDENRLVDLARRTGGEALVADLATRDGTDELAASLCARAVPDVVVHSAGVGLYAEAESALDSRVELLFAVNVMAPLRLTQALVPGMRARGSGHLVFVGSIAGALGAPRESAYASTKAALTAFAASVRSELSGDGIRVTTVLPGAVATDFFSRRGEPYRRTFPRPIRAERVAATIVRDGLERQRTDVVVPGWLRLPIAVQALFPQAYARLAGRWA